MDRGERPLSLRVDDSGGPTEDRLGAGLATSELLPFSSTLCFYNQACMVGSWEQRS